MGKDADIVEAHDWANIVLGKLDAALDVPHLPRGARTLLLNTRQNAESVATLLGRAMTEPMPEEPIAAPEEPAAPSEGETATEGNPDPRSYLKGFVGKVHHHAGDDPSQLAADWYPADPCYGLPLAMPVPLRITEQTTMSPVGTTMRTARGMVLDGPWANWILYFTHVEQVVPGDYAPGQPFCIVGVSGIEPLPGEPSHVHVYADAPGGASATPDGHGDVSAVGVLQALGFEIEVVDAVPGPVDYAAGRAFRGRLL